MEDNPVGTAFEIFWMFFEPALFGITGAAIKIHELDKMSFNLSTIYYVQTMITHNDGWIIAINKLNWSMFER